MDGPSQDSIEAAQQARALVDRGARFAAVIVVTSEGAMAIGTSVDGAPTKGWSDADVRVLTVRLIMAAAQSLDGQLGDLPTVFSTRPQ